MTVVVVGCSSSSGPAAGEASSTPTEPSTETVSSVTIPLTVLSVSGKPRLVINVSVAGGPEVPVLFDTGSTGLRIFADKVGSTGLRDLGTPISSSFTSGNHFEGTIASAPMVVGGVPTAAPVEFHKITSASCTKRRPACPAAGGEAAYIRRSHVVGIFGAGLRSGSVYSPLQQLEGQAVSSFSVSLAGDSGRVTLNPAAQDAVGTFKMPPATPPTHPNGSPAWLDQQANGCWKVRTGPRTCVATVFDTGATSTSVDPSLPGVSGSKAAPLSLAQDGAATSVWTTAGSSETPVTVHSHSGDSLVNSGVAVFEQFVVAYDLTKGTVVLGTRR